VAGLVARQLRVEFEQYDDVDMKVTERICADFVLKLGFKDPTESRFRLDSLESEPWKVLREISPSSKRDDVP
jgi:hypothetical protein